jgi:multidrug efflux pump subunit AcrA (membrane-fusion protein)
MSKPVKFKVANCDLKEIRKNVNDLKQKILVIRGQRVMQDRDLAELYGVTTKRLNQQLNRNRHRFPKDFAFRLTLAEAKKIEALRLQNATLKRGQHIKHSPHAFTEHGAIMLASVLHTQIAIQASVYVVRAFVQMRSALMEYAHLAIRIDALEERYDGRFKAVFAAIRELMLLPEQRPRQIGFVGHPGRKGKKH